jgi:hypothetical protein
VAAVLAGHAGRVLAVECYPGVHVDEIEALGCALGARGTSTADDPADPDPSQEGRCYNSVSDERRELDSADR